MTHRRHCVLVEGFPYCWGTGKPDFFDGELIDGLVNPHGIKLSQKIDPFGGIAECDDLSVTLSDTGNKKLSQIFRFYDGNSSEVYTRPIDVATTTVSLSTSLHGTRKAMSLPGSGDPRVTPDKAAWDFGGSYSFEYWYYLPSTGVSQFTHRKENQVAGAFSGSRKAYGLFHGALNYFAPNNTMAATGWYHIGGTYDEDTQILNVYTNNTQTQFTSVPNTSAAPTVPFYMYGSIIATSPAIGDFARIRVWKRALSQTEWGNAYNGKPVDETDLFYSSEWMEPYEGSAIWDKSGTSNHLSIAVGATWVDRTLIRGDKLYAPRNTWRVTSLSGAVAKIEQEVYACTSAPNAFYYDTSPIDSYTCLVHYDGPRHYQNRLMSYYRDDGDGWKLRWLGYTTQIAQLGTSWNLRGTHVLNTLKKSVQPGQASLRLDHSNGKEWQIDKVAVYWQANDGGAEIASYTWTPPDDEYFTKLNWTARFNNIGGSEVDAVGPIWLASPLYGLAFYGPADAIQILDHPIAAGTLQALFDNPPNLTWQAGVNRAISQVDGIKRYGIILNNTFKIPVQSSTGLEYVGRWIEINGWLYYIDGTDAYTDPYGNQVAQVTLDGAYRREDFFHEKTRTAGTSSEGPISLRFAAIVESPSLPQLFYRLLVSTGNLSNHGQHDTLPGYIGMGIDEGYIDDALLQASHNNQWIRSDIEGAELDNELMSNGYGLIFENERFKIISVTPPIIQKSSATITDTDLEHGTQINLNWGYYQPLNSISYKYRRNGQEYELRYSVTTDSTFGQSVNNSKEWESSINYYIDDEESFSKLQYRRLQWYSNYVPATEMIIPGNEGITIGDTITLNLNQCAGEGWYGITSVPAIVVAKKDDFTYQVVLNTSPEAQRAKWCPGWIIESYSGDTMTVRGDTSWLDENDPDDFGDGNWAVYTGDGTIDVYEKITGWTSTTITINDGLSYDQDLYIGYFSFMPYTTGGYSQTEQDGWVWCADDSGDMSDSDDGKKLY